jgi:hypothetical protein
MIYSDKELHAIEELLIMDGWKLLSRHLKEREMSLLEGLVTERDKDNILYNQAYVRALREFQQLPKNLAKRGGPNGET